MRGAEVPPTSSPSRSDSSPPHITNRRHRVPVLTAHDRQLTRSAFDAGHLARQQDLPTAELDLPAHPVRDGDVVGDRRLRRVRAAMPAAWGSISGWPTPRSAADRAHRSCVRCVPGRRTCPSLRRRQRRRACRTRRTAAHARRSSPGALSPVGAQLRLEASGFVVDACVDNTGVVARLVCGQSVLSLEDQDPRAGAATQQLPSDREPDDPSADDADGLVTRRHVRPPICDRGRGRRRQSGRGRGSVRCG